MYGVPLFLLLPYLTFFTGFYTITEDLHQNDKVWDGYSIYILWTILRAIKHKFRQDDLSVLQVSKWEALSVYVAVLPWVLMTVFAYFEINQWIEVLFTNLGFIVITLVFMTYAVGKQR